MANLNIYSNFKIIFALIILAILCADPIDGSGSAQRRRKQFKYCKVDHLIECFAEPINYFTAQPNGTGIASTEQQMEQFCFNQHDYLPYCAKQWTKRCASTIHGQLLEKLFIIPMKQSMFEFCNSNGTIRTKFLRNAPCLINQVKLSKTYREKCVKRIQSNFEYGHEMALKSGDLIQFARSFCCTFNEWEDCIVGELQKHCGKEAANVFPELIHHTTIDLVRGLCLRTAYNPRDQTQCDPHKYLAPADYQPRGQASDSVGSFYFSYLCPNVGYGIGNNI